MAQSICAQRGAPRPRANRGSDQGWITYVLGPGEKMWTTEDGVYSWRKHVQREQNRLPDGARVVFCHGVAWDKPQGPPSALQITEWVRENYR